MNNIPKFQLLQWKHAIKLEELGMKHSSGRSVKAHAARQLGLSPHAKAAAVLGAIALALNVAGCATCRDHPVACAIGGTIIVTSIAISTQASSHQNAVMRRTTQPTPICPGPSCT